MVCSLILLFLTKQDSDEQLFAFNNSPLPKITNCGEVCASQLVPLRHKPWEEDDDENPKSLNGYWELGILNVDVLKEKSEGKNT